MKLRINIRGYVLAISRKTGKGRLVFGIAIWDERERCSRCKKPMTKNRDCDNNTNEYNVCTRCCGGYYSENECSVCIVHRCRDDDYGRDDD